MVEQATYIELPTSMKVVGYDGSITTKKLNLPKHVSPCCGIKPPEGGWYGPFGALRLIGLGFWSLFVLVSFASLVAAFFRDWLGAAFGTLLAVGSLLASLAAASHEGLSVQVGKMAQQNDRFAENNDQLEHQLRELAGTREKLEKHEIALGKDVDAFKDFVVRFHKVNNMNAVSKLLSAFLSADALYGDRNKTLEGSECESYFNAASPILKEAFPLYDVDRLRTLAVQQGFDLFGCRMMATAVVNASKPEKSSAVLALLMFSLDGDREKCVADVAPAAEGLFEPVEIQSFLAKWTADAGGGLVARSVLVQLSKKLTQANDDAKF